MEHRPRYRCDRICFNQYVCSRNGHKPGSLYSIFLFCDPWIGFGTVRTDQNTSRKRSGEIGRGELFTLFDPLPYISYRLCDSAKGAWAQPFERGLLTSFWAHIGWCVRRRISIVLPIYRKPGKEIPLVSLCKVSIRKYLR